MSELARFKKRKKRTPGTVRVIIVFLALLAQVFLLAYFVNLLQRQTVFLYFVLEITGAAVVIVLISRKRNAAYTIVWLIVMMALPVFGYLLFLLWGTTGLSHRSSLRIQDSFNYGKSFLKQDPRAYSAFLADHPVRKRIGTYLQNEGFPIFQNTVCTYYPLGELQFKQMIADLEQAQRFIFLSYFIVAEGKLWDRIHAILLQKVKQGVEVRVMFDDLGSITKISDTLSRELQSEGIQALHFNPIDKNIFRLLINYRNHQKITIIDGNLGYTGGANIADEYANLNQRLGHWKDTAIRLEGEAVWGLTVTFLQMWDSQYNHKSDYSQYMPTQQLTGNGFYQPFSDGPVNNPQNPAEEIYRQIIAEARQYVYITTPYLVIDNSMMDMLCMAAKGGIDVRIVTPKKWDHWYVHMVTQSNYKMLMAAGVKIYEYTPGFMHSKMILSDDDHAVIGTINMDYRSFYLHFENAVWICGSAVLPKVKQDFQEVFAVSQEINFVEWKHRPYRLRAAQNVLRVFAPLF